MGLQVRLLEQNEVAGAMALVQKVFMEFEAPDQRCDDGEFLPSAVPVYQAWGFVADGEKLVEDGIRYTPMTLRR